MKIKLLLLAALGCMTFSTCIADTSKNDARKIAASIKKSKVADVAISVREGAQDDSVLVVTVNTRWHKLTSARRLQAAKTWWEQWATLRARYEEFVVVTVYDHKGKELLNCIGDSRTSAQCK